MEARLFPEGTVPEYTTAEWYVDRDRAPHIDEALHRPRLHLASQMVLEAARHDNRTVVDLGAGDGGLLTLLNGRGLRAWGYDLQPSNIAGAVERGVDVRLGNVLTDPIEWAQIAVATEMIEHLLDPHAFVVTLPPPVSWLVASSPWNETLESHYGYHTWAWDQQGYRAMFENAGWHVHLHDTAGMFQVLLMERT